MNFRLTAVALVLSVVVASTWPSYKSHRHPVMLWKATSATDTVWLLGSIHSGTEKLYPLPKEMEDAFAQSQAVIFEVDPTKMDADKLSAAVTEKGFYPSGETVLQHLDATAASNLAKICEKFGWKESDYISMKPWLLSVALTNENDKRKGSLSVWGVDDHFMLEAKNLQKPVFEEEGWEAEFASISGMPDQLEERALVKELQGLVTPKADVDLQRAWKSGDAKYLDNLTQKAFVNDPEEKKILLDDRNPHMADWAEYYLKGSTPAIMIVGAAHLVGNAGVVNILQSRGYKVEQVYATS